MLSEKVVNTICSALCAVMIVGNAVWPTAVMAVEATPPSEPLVLQTSPLPINLQVDPGKSVTTELKVKQTGTAKARLKVGLMKFTAYGEEGKPELKDREPGDDYFDWVKFDKTEFDAPVNVWQTVKMTISTPKSAAFGYYYAVTFSRVGDDVKRGDRTNSIAGATATLVLLEAVNPNAKRELQLVSFGSKHKVYEFLPAEFDVKLKNSGNVHAVPSGDVFIVQGKKQLATLPINGGFGNVLPDSNRIYPAKWTDGFPHWEPVIEDGKTKLDKNNKVVQRLVWDWGKLNSIRFGKYTAHLFAVYDDGKRDVPIETEISFWVIPWRFLLIVLVVLVLVALGVYAMVRGSLNKLAARRGRPRIRGRRR